jgi:hypothetical protein
MFAGDDQLLKLIKTVGPIQCNLRLPPKEFFADRDAGPSVPDDRRRFARNCLHAVAALQHRTSLPALSRETAWYKVVTCDLSRNGIRFLHGEQVFPTEQMSLVLHDGKERYIEIARCRRLGENCYEVGASFIKQLDAC